MQTILGLYSHRGCELWLSAAIAWLVSVIVIASLA